MHCVYFTDILGKTHTVYTHLTWRN